MTTYINPPTKCDLCDSPIVGEFSDARLPNYGSWANVCPPCAKQQGVRYGVGRGQRYTRVDGNFEKVEG